MRKIARYLCCPLLAVSGVLTALTGGNAAAQTADIAPTVVAANTADGATQSSQTYAIHAQATFTAQATPGFASPYAGANSLTPHQLKETSDVTLYAGVRPWAGGEIWINPEIDQGFGLSNTLGVAGFTSGEAYKVGKSAPYFKLPSLFLRQTLNLGGAHGTIDAVQNQLRQTQTANRIVITLGKFSVGQVFDTNAYAHDPRGDFLNWALIDTGSFDYAANAWGFTFGGAGEWYQGDWTLRTGLFDLSKLPNQPSLETKFAQYQIINEVEHRHQIAGHAGAIRITGFFTRGKLARLADAIAYYDANGSIPADLAPLRRYTDKWGVSLNAEQEVNPVLGLFLRAGYGDGKVEADDFTDIDRTLALGSQLKGQGWGRAGDRIGLAAVVNGLSPQHQQFFADGGLGTLVGDGRLPHYGREWIIEGYYDWQVMRHINLTLDAQRVTNPAYNRDRGPVNVFALRLHVGV